MSGAPCMCATAAQYCPTSHLQIPAICRSCALQHTKTMSLTPQKTCRQECSSTPCRVHTQAMRQPMMGQCWSAGVTIKSFPHLPRSKASAEPDLDTRRDCSARLARTVATRCWELP